MNACRCDQGVHCAQHCRQCLAYREANRAELELFERYLGKRPQPTHTRTWNA